MENGVLDTTDENWESRGVFDEIKRRTTNVMIDPKVDGCKLKLVFFFLIPRFSCLSKHTHKKTLVGNWYLDITHVETVMAIMSVDYMLIKLKLKRAIEEEESKKINESCYWRHYICHCFNFRMLSYIDKPSRVWDQDGKEVHCIKRLRVS